MFNYSQVLHFLVYKEKTIPKLWPVNFEWDLFFNCYVNLEILPLILRFCYFILLFLLLNLILNWSSDLNRGDILVLCQYISIKHDMWDEVTVELIFFFKLPFM